MSERQSHEEILVGEDDPSLAELLCELLDDEGYGVRHARDGRTALAAIEQRLPSLVLTDIVMPESDGVELIMALRRGHRELPVIAMSGGRRNSELYLDAARRLGAVTVLQKPFANVTLLETLRCVLTEGRAA